MDILELVSRQPDGVEAATISRRCGIPRSSTYQLLNVLAGRGLIASDGERRWRSSARLAEMGSVAPSAGDMLRVLEAFEGCAERLDLGTCARRTGLHIAALRRILPRLAEEGLLAEHDDATYSLGARIGLLATRFAAIDRLREVARPVLADLRDRTCETANLLVRDGTHAVYLDQLEGPRPQHAAAWVGRRIPLEPSATGRALAGSRRPQAMEDAVEVGVTAVACAVGDAREPLTALSVIGPSMRLRRDRLAEAKQLVFAASRELSDRLSATA
jgi:DNA-binding IclR family transcriptional regulator